MRCGRCTRASGSTRQAPENCAVDRRLDVAAMGVGRIARQPPANFHRLGVPRQDRDAVPTLLTMPDRTVAGGSDGGIGKSLVGRLQLLKTDNIRRGLFEPCEQNG